MPISSREAVKLIRENGGVLVRHGSNHDVYRLANGEVVVVPRHPGDLSPGVEQKIKKQLKGQ